MPLIFASAQGSDSAALPTNCNAVLEQIAKDSYMGNLRNDVHKNKIERRRSFSQNCRNTMKIVNGFDLMKYAGNHGYMLPAFNTTNMEMTYAIAKGLNMAGLPGYIQISSNNLRLSNPDVIACLTSDALKNSDVPVGLHLDHGKSYEDVKACVNAGFTSIMIDASHLPFEENIKEVQRAVRYCHFYGIPVEAELGALRGKEEDIVNEADCKTDPDMVLDFVEQTGCDLLAVSVGNVHGLDIEPKVDLPLLKTISEISPVPLVMHGGSGIPFDVVKEARKYNLLKINYGSDLRKAFVSTFGKAYEANHNTASVIELSMEAVENVSKKAAELVTIINS
jgi:fructose-bisphosphate aldolase class II